MSPGGGEFGNDSRLVSPYAPLAVTIPALLKRYGLTRLSDLDDFLRRLFEESYGRRLEAIHKIKIPRIAALVDTDAGPCFLRVFEAEVGAEWLEFQMQVVDAIRRADIPSPAPIVTSENATYFNF